MRRRREAGFGLIELVITVGVIVIITTLALPSFLRYLRTAEAQADAREVAAILNRVRQQAIKENCDMTANRSTGGFTATKGANCASGAGGALTITGMTSAGLYKTSQGVTLSGSTSVTFTRLGSATSNPTFTITSTKYSTTMRVIVDLSGRITIAQ
ncbi:MAG TPA: GspH/FimT family protein [Methylomirabilota bacterium]|nr:GspH/FimT family protein [Methylomirabilota bacterium]